MVAVIVVVLLVVAAVVWLLRWRGGDEVQSVQGYRHTLDTLQDIRTRSGPGAVKVFGSGSPRPPVSAPPEHPEALPSPEPTGVRRPPATPLVFDDAAAPPPLSVEGSVPGPGRDRAISAMNHRPKRLAGPLLVVAVVLAVLAIVVAIGANARSKPRATSTSTTVPSSRGTAGSRGSHPATPRTSSPRTSTPPTTAATTTTTTLPPGAPVTSSANAATYAVPSGSYTITLGVSSGSCWVSVNAPDGKTLFTQTLSGGQKQSVQATGPVTIVVGAPSVFQGAVNSVPLTLPASYQTPFNITLQPPSSSSSTTPTTP